MQLKEAITFWSNETFDEPEIDRPLAIDAESIPGWVIAIRRPHRSDQEPYVEIWSESDFIAETEIHQLELEKVKNS